MNDPHENDKKRILCIADHPNWIFYRHIQALRRYLCGEFEIITGYRYQPINEESFDLIYPLEYMLVEKEQIHDPRKYVTGIRSWISWAENELIPFAGYLQNHFQLVHVVSRELFEVFSPYIPSIRYVTNGIDLEHFSPSRAPAQEAGKLRLGWAGRRDTFIKGYRDYIQPLTQIPGVDLNICGFVDRNFSLDEMPAFYNSIDAYVCATSFEGSNNSILEAAAMERAIITTSVGTVPELFVNRESALIVDRDPAAFQAAVEELRDNPELRIRLGRNARQVLIEKGWDWKNKAEDYRKFFQDALQNNAKPVAAWQPPSIHAAGEKRFYQTVQSQNRLLREMRLGDWVMIYDLNQRIKQLESTVDEQTRTFQAEKDRLERENSDLKINLKLHQDEIAAIRSSETHRISNALKSSWLGKLIIRFYRFFHHAGSAAP